jgi:Na+/melibiose symporter-like transporter
MEDAVKVIVSLTPTRALSLGKRNTLSSVAIGMTVVGCLFGVVIIAAVLWLFCSTWGRRDMIPVQKADIEPAKSRYGQPYIDIELGKRTTPPSQQNSGLGTQQTPRLQKNNGLGTKPAPHLQLERQLGGFQQWKEQRDTRTKNQKEYKKKNRAATTKNSTLLPVIKRPLPAATRKPVSTERIRR